MLKKYFFTKKAKSSTIDKSFIHTYYVEWGDKVEPYVILAALLSARTAPLRWWLAEQGK